MLATVIKHPTAPHEKKTCTKHACCDELHKVLGLAYAVGELATPAVVKAI